MKFADLPLFPGKEIKNSTLILAVLSGALALTTFLPSQIAKAQDQNTSICCKAVDGKTKLQAQTIATGLESPWGLAFLPDGSQLVTERAGQLRLVENGKVSSPISGLPDIAAVGQGGLLDIALDPDYQANQTLYFSFAEAGNSIGRAGYSTAIAKAVFDRQGLRLKDVETIFSANNKSGGGRHFGSRIRVASDNTLFVTLGDRGQQDRAQDPFDHAGSVIRINRDGSIPANNPFADGKAAQPEIWSIGHRNAQGAAIHPITGAFWTLAHGARGGDEINQPEAGKNYGWPVITYGIDYSGVKIGIGAKADGLEQPKYYWDPSIAPSGLAFYNPSNPKIPAWKGSLLAGALKSQLLSRLIMKNGVIVGEEHYLQEQFGRIRDVRTGPDGAVWLLTDDDEGSLIRLTQAGS